MAINWPCLTQTAGESSRLAKVDDAGVYVIRRRYDAGESPSAIAKAYDLTPSQVCKIGKRRAWTHLPEKE